MAENSLFINYQLVSNRYLLKLEKLNRVIVTSLIRNQKFFSPEIFSILSSCPED